MKATAILAPSLRDEERRLGFDADGEKEQNSRAFCTMINWSQYAITVILLIAAILEYRLKHVATDRRTRQHKTLRRIVLAVLLIGILGQQALSVLKEEHRRRDEAKKDAAAEQTRKRLESEIKDLRTVLQTNTLLSPELRSKILEISPYEVITPDIVDLEAWRADKRKRAEFAKLQEEIAKRKAAEDNLPRWTVAIPVYDYALQKLSGVLSQIAAQHGQKLTSTFRGIPAEPTFTTLGELQVGSDPNWKITIIAFQNPYISLRSGAIHLNLEAYETVVKHNYGCSSSRSNFQACVDIGIREFVTEISEREEAAKH